MQNNKRYVLAERPTGMPDETHLKLEEVPMPVPGKDEVLLKTIYLSLDPYMRGRMNAGASYAKSVEVGEHMTGQTISQVLESNSPDYASGDYVLSANGWQTHAVAPANTLYKLDPDQAPISTGVGVLGMPGFTAYVGLREFGKPQAGETVVVSAAAGAVGQVVGQIAKM
ncbi:MAG: NADP-dependent oxidoreductase, partial [Pseudohongiellaceae bacterium]